MRIGAQPIPISAIAMWIAPGPCARAKISAPPPPPKASRTDEVCRGPTRSSAIPTGICATAKVRNQMPEDRARSDAVTAISAFRTGARTARNAR